MKKGAIWLLFVRRALPLLDDNEFVPSVLGPGFLAVARVDRLFLTVADGGEALGRDAEVDQVIAGRLGPALAQRHVVLVGAALVAIPFDPELDRRLLGEQLGV